MKEKQTITISMRIKQDRLKTEREEGYSVFVILDDALFLQKNNP